CHIFLDRSLTSVAEDAVDDLHVMMRNSLAQLPKQTLIFTEALEATASEIHLAHYPLTEIQSSGSSSTRLRLYAGGQARSSAPSQHDDLFLPADSDGPGIALDSIDRAKPEDLFDLPKHTAPKADPATHLEKLMAKNAQSEAPLDLAAGPIG